MCESCEAAINNGGTKFTVVAADSHGEQSGEFYANSEFHAAYVAGAISVSAALESLGVIGELVIEALMPFYVAIRDAGLEITVYEN